MFTSLPSANWMEELLNPKLFFAATMQQTSRMNE
ncbi:hypothetical protein TSMEX_008083 [Taenia solium]|eukprot:TsM_000282200 transcript=TsM_000282200 gene=TsM_000282200